MDDVYSDTAKQVLAIQAEAGYACPYFILNGKKYLIQPGTAMRNKVLRDGGLSMMFDLQFIAVVSQFLGPTITDAKTLADYLATRTFVYLNENFKVQNVHILSGATLIMVDANAQNQNA